MNSAAERPFSVVLSDIVGNVRQIVRAEVRLATVELREEVVKIRRGAVLLGAGALLGVLALSLLLLSGVYALSTVMTPAMAALAVGGGLAGLAGVLAVVGAKQFTLVMLPPPKTSATVQETIQWAKTRAR
jgi:membrane protein